MLERRLIVATLLFLTLTMLVTPSPNQMGEAQSQSQQASTPLLTDCNAQPCRGKNEWSGGSLGIKSAVDLHYNICDAGCNYIEVGVWGKLNSNGSYLGIMTQTQYGQSTWFVWKKYAPGPGLETHFLQVVSSYAEDHPATFEVSWPGLSTTGPQYVNVQVYGGYNYGTTNTGVTTQVWDRLQVGARLQAQVNTATIADYHANNNMWRFGGDGLYYYQTNDGSKINDAAD